MENIESDDVQAAMSGQEQEAPAQTAAPETSAPEEKEVTLDDVYREANIQPQAPPVSVSPPAQPVPLFTPTIPDPYDTEAFKAYMAQQNAGMSALQNATVQVASYLNQLQAEKAKAALEADISNAVKVVNEVINYPKPKVVEALLDAKARENPQFKALWDNRAKNPQAWNQALKVVSREFQKELDYKVDPKLVESSRALKNAQRQMATTAPEPGETERWDGLAQEQFNQKWEQLLGHT